jgi:hypothetical protein
MLPYIVEVRGCCGKAYCLLPSEKVLAVGSYILRTGLSRNIPDFHSGGPRFETPLGTEYLNCDTSSNNSCQGSVLGGTSDETMTTSFQISSTESFGTISLAI